MIFFIVDLLYALFNIKVPAAFTYSSTRMALSVITALVVCIFLGPKFIRKLYELKIGQPVRKKDDKNPLLGELHAKKQDTPTMGGLLILASMLFSMGLWMDLKNVFTLILFLTTIYLGAIGAYDDYLKIKKRNSKGLRGKRKLVLQIFFGLIVALYLLSPTVASWVQMGDWFVPPVAKIHKAGGGWELLSLSEYIRILYMPFVKTPIFFFSGIGVVFAALWVAFVVTGASNAVNLTDGLDGLAAGTLMMAGAALAVFAFVANHIDIAAYLNIPYVEGAGEVAIYLAALVGGCIGFLWYNGHPAQLFMGDTGSLALGGILGMSAILLRREIVLALVGGVFVVEALSVILQVTSYRFRNKKRIFLCAPLHHHFEYKGWPETKVVLRFWIIALLLAVIGVASLRFQ